MISGQRNKTLLKYVTKIQENEECVILLIFQFELHSSYILCVD